MVQIKINSGGETFGFECNFYEGLNIIRGNNSSGKSTFVNTLMYGLGFEEVVGTKGERALTSAVRSEFQFEGETRKIDSSSVLVELENREGKIITFRRPIKSDVSKNTKLVEAFDGPLLTGPHGIRLNVRPLFVHDNGSALYEGGFLHYLESFLGMQTPKVQASSGGMTRLYPQIIAAALFIEQKRGWTDYIAGIPFYKILGAPTRVAQYLLGLDNFDLEEQKATSDDNIKALNIAWSNANADIKSTFRTLGVRTKGMPKDLESDFNPDAISIWARSSDSDVLLADAVIAKNTEWNKIEDRKRAGPTSASPEVIALLNTETEKLEQLVAKHEQVAADTRYRKTSLGEFKLLLQQAEQDYKKNFTTQKLQAMGAIEGLKTADSLCPTCGADIPDTLSKSIEGIKPMDLQPNIDYLDAQIRMLKRQITGLEHTHEESRNALLAIEKNIVDQRAYVMQIRKTVSQSDSTLEADIRKQLILESDIRGLQAAEKRFYKFLEYAKGLADALKVEEEFKKSLPKDLYTNRDTTKIGIFTKHFRANASAFNYNSAKISEVTINQDTLMPALGDIALREMVDKTINKKIRSESSASDFVRLIWAYLIALHQTSNTKGFEGNHPNFLLFDEPGQHSMSETSQKAMFKQFTALPRLQSVVAASFDESETIFQRVTDGSKFHLITLPEKLIGRLQHDGVM